MPAEPWLCVLQLFNHELLTKSLRFANLVGALLLQWGNAAQQDETVALQLGFVPEFLVEDLGETLFACARHGGVLCFCLAVSLIVCARHGGVCMSRRYSVLSYAM